MEKRRTVHRDRYGRDIYGWYPYGCNNKEGVVEDKNAYNV